MILDPVTSKVYYAQKRPSEGLIPIHYHPSLRLIFTARTLPTGGRSAIIDASDGNEFLDGSWDARTRVHEYGGAAATVFNGVLYFSNLKDNRVFRATKGSQPEPITPGAYF